jgi:hypothetical protein
VPSAIVAGASGYTGALAAKLLHRHPHFDLVAVTSRSDAGRRLDDLYPYHRVPLVLEELDLDRHAQVDAAIVAYPHGAAAPVVAALREKGVKVVDLSADFRLRDVHEYERWYVEHPHPELIRDAVYGLPERYREAVRDARLVANPGCYPTATVLALARHRRHVETSGVARALAAATVVADAELEVHGGEHRQRRRGRDPAAPRADLDGSDLEPDVLRPAQHALLADHHHVHGGGARVRRRGGERERGHDDRDPPHRTRNLTRCTGPWLNALSIAYVSST